MTREEARKIINNHRFEMTFGFQREKYIEVNTALSMAIEALEQDIVYCKDCNFYKDARENCKGFLICYISGMEITDNDFCSYGERRENKCL